MIFGASERDWIHIMMVTFFCQKYTHFSVTCWILYLISWGKREEVLASGKLCLSNFHLLLSVRWFCIKNVRKLYRIGIYERWMLSCSISGNFISIFFSLRNFSFSFYESFKRAFRFNSCKNPNHPPLFYLPPFFRFCTHRKCHYSIVFPSTQIYSPKLW